MKSPECRVVCVMTLTLDLTCQCRYVIELRLLENSFGLDQPALPGPQEGMPFRCEDHGEQTMVTVTKQEYPDDTPRAW
jgi:hypothetical protein